MARVLNIILWMILGSCSYLLGHELFKLYKNRHRKQPVIEMSSIYPNREDALRSMIALEDSCDEYHVIENNGMLIRIIRYTIDYDKGSDLYKLKIFGERVVRCDQEN